MAPGRNNDILKLIIIWQNKTLYHGKVTYQIWEINTAYAYFSALTLGRYATLLQRNRNRENLLFNICLEKNINLKVHEMQYILLLLKLNLGN